MRLVVSMMSLKLVKSAKRVIALTLRRIKRRVMSLKIAYGCVYL